MMPSASSSTKRGKPNNDNNNNHPKAADPPSHTQASTFKSAAKQAPTSHPSTNTNPTTKNPNDSGGLATAAYKLAQMTIPPRQPTPQGSEAASSQACESADVSESERGVLRRERKDVMHQGPGGEFEVTRGGR